MADKQRRLARIRAAMAQLRAEAKAGRGACDPDGPGPSSGMQERGNRRKPRATAPGDEAPAAPAPSDKAQRNFTDGDSRIMPSHGGFIAGYNGQIAVDAESQVIVAQRLGTNPADFGGLEPLVDDIMDDLGQAPGEVSGDTGFASEANLHAMDARGIEPYLCPGRMRHGSTDPEAGRILKRTPRMQQMADTIRSAGREGTYRLRKQVVETRVRPDQAGQRVANSSSGASRRFEASGPWSAPPTTPVSCTRPPHEAARASPRNMPRRPYPPWVSLKCQCNHTCRPILG